MRRSYPSPPTERPCKVLAWDDQAGTVLWPGVLLGPGRSPMSLRVRYDGKTREVGAWRVTVGKEG